MNDDVLSSQRYASIQLNRKTVIFAHPHFNVSTLESLDLRFPSRSVFISTWMYAPVFGFPLCAVAVRLKPGQIKVSPGPDAKHQPAGVSQKAC